jgi:hypothetical protein
LLPQWDPFLFILCRADQIIWGKYRLTGDTKTVISIVLISLDANRKLYTQASFCGTIVDKPISVHTLPVLTWLVHWPPVVMSRFHFPLISLHSIISGKTKMV